MIIGKKIVIVAMVMVKIDDNKNDNYHDNGNDNSDNNYKKITMRIIENKNGVNDNHHHHGG